MKTPLILLQNKRVKFCLLIFYNTSCQAAPSLRPHSRLLTVIAFFQLPGICWALPADVPTLILQPKQVNSWPSLLADKSRQVAYAEALAGFSDTSFHILAPWISFTLHEIAKTTTLLSDGSQFDRNQITYLLGPDGKLERILAWYGDKTTLPTIVLAKLQPFAADLDHVYRMVMGHPAKQLLLTVRLASDHVGHSITRAYGGDFKNGLHNHRPEPGSPLKPKRHAMDFVWAIQGLGPRILRGNTIATAAENSISFFGNQVMHGSPPSENLRLIGVGSISE